MISKTALNIITPQESKPIITITQDSLVAAYLMTRRDFALTRFQFNDLCLKCEKSDGSPIWNPKRIKHIEKILEKYKKNPSILNGKGLISLILPENFNYEKKNGAHPAEPVVKIVQGVFLEGAFDKTTLGSAHGSVIQFLNKEYGSEITANFIDNMQFLGNNWLLIYGFSVGLEDCMITSNQSVLAIKDTLTQCYTKAEGIEETTQNPGIREIRVTASLSQAKDIGMRIAKDAMKPNNNFIVAVSSGAKGDYFNIAQITGLLGQQNLEGKRVTPTLNHGKRTLPHYPFKKLEKEREYESKGFIKNSFIRGLTPEEFFFHAMSGREGVCDTALSTAKSGYIQRKIVKVCEDMQIQYDQTVRDATGKIYQFAYGNDNFDPTKTIRVKNEVRACDIERLAEKLNISYELGIEEKTKIKEPEYKSEFIIKNIQVKEEDKEDEEKEDNEDEEKEDKEDEEKEDNEDEEKEDEEKEEDEDDFLDDEEAEEPENDFDDSYSEPDD